MTWQTKTFFGRPWQDLLFAIGEIVFLLTLVPMLLEGTDVPALTGIGTAAMLYAFAVAHISYRNWITVGLSILTATLWLVIGIR